MITARCAECGSEEHFSSPAESDQNHWHKVSAGQWACDRCHQLFFKVQRRPKRMWVWAMDRRKRECQDAIFSWLEGVYIASDSRTKTFDETRYFDHLMVNDWTSRTADQVRKWAAGRSVEELRDTLQAFELYCDHHFTSDAKGKKRKAGVLAVIPAYPRFSEFLKNPSTPKRLKRSVNTK